MRTGRIAFAVLAVIVLTVSAAFVAADSEAEAGDYSLTVDGNGVITGYEGDLPRDLVIPVQVGGVTVKAIGDEAFYRNGSVRTVSFEDGSLLERIGESAFRGINGLSGGIVLPSFLKEIGPNAFSHNQNLEHITIGENVETIGDDAFSGCISIEFTVAEGNTHYTVDGKVLMDFGRTVIIQVPLSVTGSYTVPDTVTEIGTNAFLFSNVTSVSIPSSVKTIADEAFYSSHYLKKVTMSEGLETIGEYAFFDCTSLEGTAIPSTVKSIGDNAFSACPRLGLSVPSDSQYYCVSGGVLFSKDMKVLVQAFGSHTGVYTVPATVEKIGGGAFREYDSLTGLKFESGSVLKDIEDWAFAMCTGIKNKLVLPETLENIGFYAFGLCSAIPGLDFGKSPSLKTVGEDAFLNCSGLSGDLKLPETVTGIGASAFNGCSGLVSVTVPDGVSEIPGRAFSDCTSMKYLYLPGSLAIGSGAFRGCDALVYIQFESSPRSVAENSFSVDFADSKGKIPVKDEPGRLGGIFSFQESKDRMMKCHYVTMDVAGQVPKYVLVFEGDRLNSGKLPQGYPGHEVIGWDVDITKPVYGPMTTHATVKVTGTDKIVISGTEVKVNQDGTATIGSSGTKLSGDFDITDYCTYYDLSGKFVKYSVTAIGDYAFDQQSELTGKLNLPSTVVSIGQGAFQGCSGFTGTVVIPGSVKDVGSLAFNGCTGINEVKVPGGVKIGSQAFKDCSGLEYVVFDGTPAKVDKKAFPAAFYDGASFTDDVSRMDGSFRMNGEQGMFYELYTVTFDSDGGSAVDPQEVMYGECASEPRQPSLDGYEFGGWTLDGKKYDFSTPVTDDVVLKVSWNEEISDMYVFALALTIVIVLFLVAYWVMRKKRRQ